mmetsp:Transcript_9788/g.28732  ORF Transcript_9788/g.28732 Transcript_9788/m.28732 type:complete len:355 (-) Transcript_9788:103-1167(-)
MSASALRHAVEAAGCITLLLDKNGLGHCHNGVQSISQRSELQFANHRRGVHLLRAQRHRRHIRPVELEGCVECKLAHFLGDLLRWYALLVRDDVAATGRLRRSHRGDARVDDVPHVHGEARLYGALPVHPLGHTLRREGFHAAANIFGWSEDHGRAERHHLDPELFREPPGLALTLRLGGLVLRAHGRQVRALVPVVGGEEPHLRPRLLARPAHGGHATEEDEAASRRGRGTHGRLCCTDVAVHDVLAREGGRAVDDGGAGVPRRVSKRRRALVGAEVPMRAPADRRRLLAALCGELQLVKQRAAHHARRARHDGLEAAHASRLRGQQQRGRCLRRAGCHVPPSRVRACSCQRR